MAWFKVDDHFWSHPKSGALSDSATALWLRAGSWAAGHLTDGFIPESQLRFFRARRRSVAELVSVGLWSGAEGGYMFHDWAEYQPSKEVVTARRDATKKRVNDWRERKGNGVTETFAPQVRNAAPDPTRPDPTRPVTTKKASPSRRAEIRLPKDWSPTPEHEARAVELRVNCKDQADSFRLHAEAHDRHAANWNAAFTMWLKKATPGTPKKFSPDREWMGR